MGHKYSKFLTSDIEMKLCVSNGERPQHGGGWNTKYIQNLNGWGLFQWCGIDEKRFLYVF